MNSGKTKPIASLSLDLDNKWSYMKTHGNKDWEALPTYLPRVVPRILKSLRDHSLKITFFIVGQDASIAENHAVLRQIADDGHESGNHSFMHEPWLHLYQPEQLQQDLQKAHDAIEQATGKAPIGFRGPGFSISNDVLKTVKKMGYRFDATTFPNLLNPVGRWYFFWKSDLTAEEKEQRSGLFGTMKDALNPIKPYRWQLDDGELVEIPVTTMPLIRIPIHYSYVLYLATYSRFIAKMYYRISLGLCRLFRVQPSLLLHPLDFMGNDDDPELKFFPGMNMPQAVKLEIMDELLGYLSSRFEVVTMSQHAQRLDEERNLPRREPAFSL